VWLYWCPWTSLKVVMSTARALYKSCGFQYFNVQTKVRSGTNLHSLNVGRWNRRWGRKPYKQAQLLVASYSDIGIPSVHSMVCRSLTTSGCRPPGLIDSLPQLVIFIEGIGSCLNVLSVACQAFLYKCLFFSSSYDKRRNIAEQRQHCLMLRLTRIQNGRRTGVRMVVEQV
jgi:hypothetical protein